MAIDPKQKQPGGPKTVNEEFLDSLVRHQIYLQRLSGGIRNRVVELLNKTEGDIVRVITDSGVGEGGGSPANVRRLERLLKKIRKIRDSAFDKTDEVWMEELNALSLEEPKFTAGITNTLVPVVIDTQLPSPGQLKEIVRAQPFEGKILREWASSLRRDDLARISDQIKIGMVQGESTREITRRVVGTQALSGTDGITQLTRANAEAITRTAVNHISNQARREFFKENSDIFTEEQFVATLDSRTTPICRSLDGKTFPVGEGPIPPLHFNCRSLRVAVIDGQGLGERPANPTTERRLLRRFTNQEGITNVANRNLLPRGLKGKYDVFKRREVRQSIGRVPGNITYQDWLKRQPIEVQDDILGRTKGQLFRKGGLTLDKFVNRRGDELTLSELASKHESAFRAAGLNPRNFTN